MSLKFDLLSFILPFISGGGQDLNILKDAAKENLSWELTEFGIYGAYLYGLQHLHLQLVWLIFTSLPVYCLPTVLRLSCDMNISHGVWPWKAMDSSGKNKNKNKNI